MKQPCKEPFGEVVASTLDSCTIQAWEWDQYPAFGSLVAVQEQQNLLIALVQNIITAPLDSARMPIAYKKTDVELKAEYPHIFSLLRTTVSCVMLGTYDVQYRFLQLPIKPAIMHSFAATYIPDNDFCTQGYIKRIIMVFEPAAADNLVTLHMLHEHSAGRLTPVILRSFIQTYIEAVGTDYKRIFALNSFVQQRLTV